VNGSWPGVKELPFFLISVSSNPLLSRTLGFFGNFVRFVCSGSSIAAWGLAVNRSSDGEENCVVYSLFCIFLIIIAIIIVICSINISIHFVVPLNCLYLNA